MIKILITGGCGFVGTNLALKLISEQPKSKIFIYDNFFRKENISNTNYLKHKNITITKKDCAKVNKFPLVDIIFHLASDPAVTSGMINKSNIFNNNLASTNNILNFYSKYKTPIIFLSSSRVYSIDAINSLNYKSFNNRFILSENRVKGLVNGSITESFSTEGFKSLYGFTKLSSEDLIIQYSRINKFNFIINRSGLICGKYQRGNIQQGIVSFLAKSALEKKTINIFGYNGYQVRDILNIENLCKIMILQMHEILSKKSINKLYNIGGGYRNSDSLINLIDIINKKIKLKFQIKKDERFADIKYYVTSNSKIMNDYNWKPDIGYIDSINECIDFMKYISA